MEIKLQIFRRFDGQTYTPAEPWKLSVYHDPDVGFGRSVVPGNFVIRNGDDVRLENARGPKVWRFGDSGEYEFLEEMLKEVGV